MTTLGIAAAVLVVCGSAEAGTAVAAPRPLVTVVTSDDTGRFAEVIAALRAALEATPPRARPELRIVRMPPDAVGSRNVAQDLVAAQPVVVVALGRHATVEVVEVAPEQPLVVGMVVDTVDLARARNATAVVLGHSFEAQLAELRRVLPDCRTFGIIHDARLVGPVRAAATAADALGLRLEARPIHTPKELPRAMGSLTNSICALLGVPDPMVLSRHAAHEILLFSFRHRIPFIGPSESWVEAGALYALDWRYDAIGRQLAGLALQVVGGAAPRSLPRQWPDAARLVVNPGTAVRLGVELPRAVIEGADRVD